MCSDTTATSLASLVRAYKSRAESFLLGSWVGFPVSLADYSEVWVGRACPHNHYEVSNVKLSEQDVLLLQKKATSE
jgi:hypothetical protein